MQSTGAPITGNETVGTHASAFARIALDNIAREYPHKLDHLVSKDGDLRLPRALHPVFYGSYDWHSSVHMHWLLASLLRRVPDIAEAERIAESFDRHFTRANVAAEIDYLQHPEHRSFERTYGWAWLLKLQAELRMLALRNTRAQAWSDALQPLADLLVERYLHYLPLANYPIRAGTHANSAFGLLLALDYAEQVQHLALRKLIIGKANSWFGRDRRYPAGYEPGGEDFLSGGLLEAALMRRVGDSCSYADWWEVFCPSQQDLLVWLTPVAVSDRSDPRLAHLDGLNLSRAWCWKMLAGELPQHLRQPAAEAVTAHLQASLPQAIGGHYVGTHWLASFALLALADD
ncbi:DUF2891 domain-containing protein [Noviherbaspirillum saxi]|uniref:DUF2891 domain-containing protein n=1 Tax=Noviherbaspirillum saxi TaxID=2320863 RepID=A0A3A3GFD9_9BURK|nr:DUF2891 domain-containing protein [Noviherbaspirillum saxi]RJF99619.1 DUF2891 domain-containing protein [Noviherbaspirillum saxi]